jgi:hypothetical protein
VALHTLSKVRIPIADILATPRRLEKPLSKKTVLNRKRPYHYILDEVYTTKLRLILKAGNYQDYFVKKALEKGWITTKEIVAEIPCSSYFLNEALGKLARSLIEEFPLSLSKTMYVQLVGMLRKKPGKNTRSYTTTDQDYVKSFLASHPDKENIELLGETIKCMIEDSDEEDSSEEVEEKDEIMTAPVSKDSTEPDIWWVETTVKTFPKSTDLS